MAKHEPKWWADRLEEVAAGADAAEVALRHGVREQTLLWWRSELQRRKRKPAPSAKPRLLPVVVAAPRAVAVGAGVELVVEIGRTRMTMRGCVSAEHLAAIVTASARAC